MTQQQEHHRVDQPSRDDGPQKLYPLSSCHHFRQFHKFRKAPFCWSVSPSGSHFLMLYPWGEILVVLQNSSFLHIWFPPGGNVLVLRFFFAYTIFQYCLSDQISNPSNHVQTTDIVRQGTGGNSKRFPALSRNLPLPYGRGEQIQL